MSKFEGHTPGPWKWDTCEEAHNYGVNKWWFRIKGVFDIRRGGSISDHIGISEANAELIAAAPDLLAENERLRGMCETMVEALEEINDANQVNRLGSEGELTARNVSEIVLAKWEKMKEDLDA